MFARGCGHRSRFLGCVHRCRDSVSLPSAMAPKAKTMAKTATMADSLRDWMHTDAKAPAASAGMTKRPAADADVLKRPAGIIKRPAASMDASDGDDDDDGRAKGKGQKWAKMKAAVAKLPGALLRNRGA